MGLNGYLGLIYEFVFCFAATAFFAILMRAPDKTIIFSSFIAGVSYVIFRALLIFSGNEILSYFVGALFVAVAGETAARVFKMPSTVFVLPGIIPLVPGVGLYKSMIELVRENYSEFLKIGSQTLFISAVIAISIATVNILARFVFPQGNH